MKSILVTGSSGLIGSEVCGYFAGQLGHAVHGVDNNQRAVFFSPQGTHAGTSKGCKRKCRGLSIMNWTSVTAPAFWRW